MSEYLLPDVGEGLTEAEIVSWKVKVGDVVAINDIVVEIETAKSLVELPSPYEGEVTALLVAEGEMVEVGTEGTITAWSWVAEAREGQALDHPHALALVQLDGADTAMLHAVDAPGPGAVSTGARVSIRWAEEPEGLITDIACFELSGGAA